MRDGTRLGQLLMRLTGRRVTLKFKSLWQSLQTYTAPLTEYIDALTYSVAKAVKQSALILQLSDRTTAWYCPGVMKRWRLKSRFKALWS